MGEKKISILILFLKVTEKGGGEKEENAGLQEIFPRWTLCNCK